MQRSIAGAIGLAMLALGSSAGAQRLVSVGVGGGASVPTGTLGDRADAGWHGLATVIISAPIQPLGLRLDGAYNRFRIGLTGANTSDNTQGVLSGTLNFTYRLPSAGWPASPYVITGVGAYHSSCSGGASCPETTKFGWNAGLGTKLAVLGLRPFLEARYHSIAGGAHYFPVTLGLTF
jgi:hypothetical protein